MQLALCAVLGGSDIGIPFVIARFGAVHMRGTVAHAIAIWDITGMRVGAGAVPGAPGSAPGRGPRHRQCRLLSQSVWTLSGLQTCLMFVMRCPRQSAVQYFHLTHKMPC